MARAAKKSSRTGTVEIKKCGFNQRPMLMASSAADDEGSAADVLPELFRGFDGKKVKVTIELMKP